MPKKRQIVMFLLLALFTTAGCSKIQKASQLNKPETKRVETKDTQLEKPLMKVKIYYPYKDSLFGEEHYINREENPPKAALNELLKSKPLFKSIRPVLPSKARVIDVQIKNGLVVVNFTREILDFKGNETEQKLAWAAIIKTVSQFSQVNRVKFQVEGREKGRIDGKKIENWWGKVTLKHQPWRIEERQKQ
jgi:hypothetical protein